MGVGSHIPGTTHYMYNVESGSAFFRLRYVDNTHVDIYVFVLWNALGITVTKTRLHGRVQRCGTIIQMVNDQLG